MSCVSSFFTVEDMRDSTMRALQIVKIMRMVVKFHPLLIVTSVIFRVMFLQLWIEEVVSNQWKIIKVYCQSVMRALLDTFTEKMKNASEALQMHLQNEVTKGQLKAILIGKLALFSATFLLLDSEFNSKYDKKGTKTQLLLIVGLILLTHSKLWSELRILRGSYGCTTNSTLNFTFFILALLFARFFDNSLRSLSFMFCIIIFFLCLLVILQPRTDLGLFSFIIGVIGSITYNRYELNFPTWIIASICFMLFSFKSWLDKYWLDLEEDPSASTRVGSTNGILILLSSAGSIASTILVSSVVKSPLSNYKRWLAEAANTVLWTIRFYKLYPNPKDSSLPITNGKGISGLILIVVNVAQGIFAFAIAICLVADYKDWVFAIISYVVFCFWVRSFFPNDLSPPSTNIKGIKGKIWALQSVAKYGIMVLTGLETRVHYNELLVAITCYVLWWVRLRTSFSKDLLQSATNEFKAAEWWTVVAYSTISDVIRWIQLLTTTHQQEG